MQIHFRAFAQNIISRLQPKIEFGRFFSEFWLKHVEPNAIFRLWFVLPFNGQARRLFCFLVISHIFRPTIGIETGTFYGTSTYLFRGIPTIKRTYSIEVNPIFFKIAFARHYQEVESGKLVLINGDSKSEISNILVGLNPKTERIVAYLDAHWEGDIPTIEEVKSLMNWRGSWVAVIDDFQVPGTDGVGYGYDSYDNKVVNSELFNGLGDVSILVPSDEASFETGAKRGTGYLVGGRDHEKFAKLMALKLPLKLLQS